MSVDIFGDCGTSSSGPRGPAGKDGFDIVKWLPKFVLSQFQKSEELCCFVINDLGKDLEKSGEDYVKWISRSDKKKNAVAIKASKSIKLIKKEHWGLKFNSSLYHIALVPISSLQCVFACVTFQLDGENEQFIFNDFIDDVDEKVRGVSATRNSIIIWGVDNVSNYISIPFKIDKDAWTTVLVEWLPDKVQGEYIINNKENGTFTCNKVPEFHSDDVYLGGRIDSKKSLSGSISAFEIYRSKEKTPASIKDLVVQGQMNISL